MIIYDPKITGSFQVNGSSLSSLESIDSVSGSVVDLTAASSSLSTRVSDQESFSSSLDATFATDADLNLVSSSVDSLNAATSSYALENSISGSFTSLSSSIASELLKNTTDTLTGDLTVTGTLTAQDLHVQEVTSSIVFSSGSNKFGALSTDTQEFTGSLQVSGSATFAGTVTSTGLQVNGATFLDVMPNHQSEGIIRIGRYDSNTSRYHDIKSYVSSTQASNYLKFSLHGGTENTVADVLTLKGDLSATFASDLNIAAGKKLAYSSNAFMTPENNVTGAEISTPGDFRVKTGTSPTLALTLGGSQGATFAGKIICNNVGNDRKIEFNRTGSNVYSIEHDSAFLYFYNVTTNSIPLKLANNNDATFAGKVSVGGGDTSTAQVALKGQQSLLSFVRGTSGDAQFFMSSDSARLYFSHTDVQSTNLILTLNQDKSATFAGDITLDDDLNFSTNGFADISNTGTGAMRFKPSSQTLALTLTGANATFAGTINSDNITVGKTDGNNSSISLTANTGNWTFTNVQSSRNLEISDSDGTGVAMTIDTSANATFAGIVTTDKIFVAKGQNVTHATSAIKISQENTTKSQIRCYGADATTAGTFELVLSANDGVPGYTALAFDNTANATFAGEITSGDDINVGGKIVCANVGSDKKIAFRRTGANNFSIEHDSSSLYFYNETTSELPIRFFNNGNVSMIGGNVGIGTTSPNKALTVYGSNDNGIWIDSQGDQYTSLAFGHNGTEKANISWDNTNGYTNISTYGNGHLALTTGGSISAFLSYAGYLGIGTTSPGAQLHNYSTATTNVFMTGHGTAAQNDWGAQNAMFVKTDNGLLISKANVANNTNRIFNFYNDANGYAQLYMHAGSTAAKVQIQASGNSYFNGGNVGIGSTSPTRKLDVAGEITHEGLVPKAGAFVDGLVTINKTVSTTAATWTSLDISLSNIGGSGTFAVQVYSNAHGSTGGAWYSMYWSGMMSWYHSNVNSTDIDEISLHAAGHAMNGNTLELRTKLHTADGTSYANRCELQIKTANTLSSAPISFRFRKLL